jgi:hypothetical protein
MRPARLLTLSAVTWCITASACQVTSALTTTRSRDLVAHLIAQNDEAIPAQLARQSHDRSKPTFGGIPAENGLYHAGAASGFLCSLTAAYVSPASRYGGSPELLQALDDAATFLLAAQHEDGTIDLLTTNFHSPPDTGFVLEWVCAAASVLQSAQIPAAVPVLKKLLTFIRRGADALAIGGIHTPNHRWVVSMALARANALIPDSRYVNRIDTWLAENIDIDPDGQFTERSTSVYSPLIDRCLVTIARLLDRPHLLDPARRNLEMSLYYLHANGEIATEGSRRQDQYQRSSMVPYYYAYRYMALHDHDGRFAAVVHQLENAPGANLSGQLIYFLESPELAAPLPDDQSLPSDFERHFAHSKLVRIRRAEVSATILEDNPTFFSLHVGTAAVVMRFASAFFGKGQFVGSELHQEGSTWVLRQELTGPYYQPIAAAQRRADGNWLETGPDRRPTSEVQQLQSLVKIREQSGGFDVELEITGTDGVPIAIELGCDEGTQVSGTAPIAGGPVAANAQSFLLTTGKATLSVGKDHIDLGHSPVGDDQVEHSWTQIRGALPKLPGKSLYITGFTPFRRILEFRK